MAFIKEFQTNATRDNYDEDDSPDEENLHLTIDVTSKKMQSSDSVNFFNINKIGKRRRSTARNIYIKDNPILNESERANYENKTFTGTLIQSVKSELTYNFS